MSEDLVKHVKTVEDAQAHAKSVLTVITLITLEPSSYNSMYELCTALHKKAIELGDKSEWFNLPQDARDAMLKLYGWYN